MHRTLLFTITSCFLGPALTAQAPLRDQLKDTAPNERWVYDDWKEARKQARKASKPIFAVFRCVP